MLAACAASFVAGFSVGCLRKARWFAGQVREFIAYVQPLVSSYALATIKAWWCQ